VKREAISKRDYKMQNYIDFLRGQAVLRVWEHIGSGSNNFENYIRTIGEHLTKDFGKFEEFTVDNRFSGLCKATERAVKNNKSQFIVSNLNDDHWVLLCIIEDTVLYKDPLGDEIPTNLKNEMEKCAKNSTLRFKSHRMSEQKDVKNNAILVLNNLKILVEAYFQNKPSLIARFESIKLSTEKDLDDFKNTIKRDFEAKIIESLDEIKLKENDEITKKVFKKMIEISSEMLEIKGSADDYATILNNELEMQEKNSSYRINEAKIQAAREVFLNGAKKFQTDFNDPKLKVGKRLSDLEKQYPKQFEAIMNILNKISSLPEKFRDQALEKINKSLKIDLRKLKKLYGYFKSGNGEAAKESLPKNNEDIVIIPDINVIGETLKKNISVDNDTDIKSLEQLLSELVLGKDNQTNQITNTDDFEFDGENITKYYRTLYANKTDILQLEDNFKSVMKHYDSNWNNTFEVSQFRNWAVSKKGHLKDSEVHEALAMMKRTIELIKGYDLRNSSILSALVFLRNDSYKGKLVQIQTGEGKTNIVSLLAAIKVLQGKKVDVITSNEVLAKEGVKSTRKFFNVFGITMATNNPDDSYKKSGRGCYKADVVYGNIGNFQFDYLRDFSEDLGTRGGREFSVVILDEVDSMLLDNGGHIAKLAAPFPGMDILKYIYIKTWEELHVAEEEIVSETLRKITEFPGNSTQQFQSAMYGQTAYELENITDKIAEKNKIDSSGKHRINSATSQEFCYEYARPLDP
jgi:hypothetical protein